MFNQSETIGLLQEEAKESIEANNVRLNERDAKIKDLESQVCDLKVNMAADGL
jgi:hypothetical protein